MCTSIGTTFSLPFLFFFSLFCCIFAFCKKTGLTENVRHEKASSHSRRSVHTPLHRDSANAWGHLFFCPSFLQVAAHRVCRPDINWSPRKKVAIATSQVLEITGRHEVPPPLRDEPFAVPTASHSRYRRCGRPASVVAFPQKALLPATKVTSSAFEGRSG